MKQFTLCVAVLLVLPLVAFAEEGQGHHVASFSDLTVFWLNFVVYLMILYFLLRKPVPALWAKRRQSIEHGVRTSAQELAQAKQNLNAARQKLSNLESDIALLREEMRMEIQAEQQALEEYGKSKSAKILARARDNYQTERRSFEQKLQHEISELALKLVRDRLSSEISAESDRTWRDAALKNVKGLVH